MAALLPLMWLGAAALRGVAMRRNFSPALPLAIVASVVLCTAVGAHLLFAVLYFLSPAFSDHIEPTTAIVAWIYAEGGQIYHALDAPERYSFLYGPVPYIATAWVYELVGPGPSAAKFAGLVCLLLSYALLAMSVRQRFKGQLIPYIVAFGYFALLALFFKNHSFWSKPDPFMILAATLGLYSCLIRPGRMAWLLCGIALGIAVNGKVTGAVYFLPYLAWFFDRDGYRAPLVILPAAAVIALLPFLSVEQVSLQNYLAWLQAARNHGISLVLFLQNLTFLLFILAPVGLFLLWQLGSVGMRSWFVRRKLVSAISVAAALLILVAGSKPGSGPHHFLPFFPALAFLTAHAVSRVHAYRPTTGWSVYGFWAPLSAFLITAVIKSAVALYFGISVVFAQANETVVADELAAIMAEYPGRNIYMGYGDGDRYVSTFLRTDLAFAGNPYLLDFPALLDFEFSGVHMPAATIEKILGDESAVWLIPAGEQPFMMPDAYRPGTGALLFEDAFRAMFADNFMKTASGRYFDVYVRRPPETGAP
jgi:hypothetical protein